MVPCYRLWGSAGQKRFRQSSVLILGSNGLASEIGKNLVLPGTYVNYPPYLKFFRISSSVSGLGECAFLDDALVCASDLGTNFFVAYEHLGHPRAQVPLRVSLFYNPASSCCCFPPQCVLDHLLRLNPDTQGVVYLEVCCELKSHLAVVSKNFRFRKRRLYCLWFSTFGICRTSKRF